MPGWAINISLLRSEDLSGRTGHCSRSSIFLRGARAEADLGGRGQDGGLVVDAQRLLQLLRAREPARDGEIISRQHAREPVRAVLREPPRAVRLAQLGQLLGQLAQGVVD